jgi:hypothetical protein
MIRRPNQAHFSLDRTINTGTSLLRITLSATLPMAKRVMPPRPCVAMAIFTNSIFRPRRRFSSFVVTSRHGVIRKSAGLVLTCPPLTFKYAPRRPRVAILQQGFSPLIVSKPAAGPKEKVRFEFYMKIGGTGFNLSPANFENQPAHPTTALIFIVRCDHQSWGLYQNVSSG